MSRTHRHMKSSKFRLKDELWTYDYILKEFDSGYQWRQLVRVNIDPKSDRGKSIIAKFHSDCNNIMIWNGPMWFLHLYVQVPYRAKCKRELHKFLRNHDHEVILESKPHRQYYW